MNKLLKTAILAVASIAAISAPLAAAQADSWNRGGWERRGWDNGGWNRGGWNRGGWNRPYYRHHRNRGGDALAAGVIGLAAGALIGSALSQQQPTYVQPAPVYAPPPPPVYYPAPPARSAAYRVGYEPWSRGWYQYCSNRYRSFNPSTGTYRGYDGRDHFCSAN
ncbi:BA14K family protein [Brucella gallinifaecis]|uniref:Lectin-like protein BA14k n=1 Tax=Brucella gallinifaecis TaxID=215590 RepID=A0A502BSA5_9HYPH|nr:BA14K family protein [Brucella gallinifaecis]TPF76561.1 BA14K family protein [Brucella gallinifaecis]